MANLFSAPLTRVSAFFEVLFVRTLATGLLLPRQYVDELTTTGGIRYDLPKL